PSQNGLRAEAPQRQRLMRVRPASPKLWPAASQICTSPSMTSDPLLLTVILVMHYPFVARRAMKERPEHLDHSRALSTALSPLLRHGIASVAGRCPARLTGGQANR